MKIDFPVSLIMTIAIINGLITSIIFETIILSIHKIIEFNMDIYAIYKHFDNVIIKNIINYKQTVYRSLEYVRVRRDRVS